MRGASDAAERVAVAILGHVDHGKSTLIGRLLLDTHSVPDGRTEAIRQACAAEGVAFEPAFLMDALLEEQQQNVTIDTTRIPFRTARREYVVIDAPGHTEFLKNMVSGASSASAALLVIDGDAGVGEQSRRHGYLLGLLGVSRLVVLVNKMDLCGYREERYLAVVDEYRRFLAEIGLSAAHFIPISAREGDNVAFASTHMGWWQGPTVLQALDQFESPPIDRCLPLRYVVQDVYRLDERRVIAGRVESGVLRVGSRIAFMPGGRISTVKSIERWGATPTTTAEAGESIGITLGEQLFVERGAIGSSEEDPPFEGQQFRGRVFWMSESPLTSGRSYHLRLATQDVIAEVASIDRIIDAVTLAEIPQSEGRGVRRHEVAEVTIRTRQPISFDAAERIPVTGRFVLIEDRRPSGGGIVLPGDYYQRVAGGPTPVGNLYWANGQVTPQARAARDGWAGRVVWFTGLSGAGKSTIAIEAERQLFNLGRHVYLLDGDNLRHGLCAGLGFSAADRSENIRRAAEVAKLFADAGVLCLAAFISPLRTDRDRARRLLPAGRFIEVHVATPLDVCKQRDPKGLYARAERGEIPEFTGVSAPYEAPLRPELVLRADQYSVTECVAQLLEFLERVRDA